MDMSLLFEAVDNFGFPIVCAAAMMWFIWQIFKKSTEREERLYQQMDKFSDTLNRFDTTLTKIDTRLEVVEEHILNKE